MCVVLMSTRIDACASPVFGAVQKKPNSRMMIRSLGMFKHKRQSAEIPVERRIKAPLLGTGIHHAQWFNLMTVLSIRSSDAVTRLAAGGSRDSGAQDLLHVAQRANGGKLIFRELDILVLFDRQQ